MMHDCPDCDRLVRVAFAPDFVPKLWRHRYMSPGNRYPAGNVCPGSGRRLAEITTGRRP